VSGSGYAERAEWHDARRGWSIGLLVDGLAALALTFGVAHYGLGMAIAALPWLVVRERSRPWPWGWFSLAGLALTAAIAGGVSEFGTADHALWAAGLQAVIWIHACGWVRWFWGGLTGIGLVWVGAGLIAAWVSAGLDFSVAVSAWWDGWHWPVIAALGCGVVWVLTFGGEGEPTSQGGGFTLSASGVDVSALRRRLAVGLAGEARVRALFLEELPEGMWVLNNLRLPGLGGDIDLLVVGANGVFLPEVKTWSGAISCAPDGRTWSRVRAGRWELLPNPAAQTQGEIRALRRYLESADPQLCRRTQLWIEGLIVFAHHEATVDADYSPLLALSPQEAVEAIRTAVARRALSPRDQERIVELVSAVQPALPL
jgi:hypothetical protein